MPRVAVALAAALAFALPASGCLLDRSGTGPDVADAGERDAGETDAGERDAGSTGPDAGERDAGERDAGETDAGVPPDGGASPDACVPAPELCDGVDNDCDPATPDGSGDPLVGAPCDGADADLCEGGTYGPRSK